MKNSKKAKAMILAELILAFSVCAIIFVLLVINFAPTDVQIRPYAYFLTHNLSEANQIIINKCRESGHCQENMALPNNSSTYCRLLAENFSNVSFSDCTDVANADNQHKFQLAQQNETVILKKNIQFSNGVAIYGLAGPNPTTGNNNGQSINWINGANNVNIFAPYVDVFVDTNGNNNNFTQGVEVFPLRIFRNGDIIPGFDFANNRNVFSYNVVLNRASATGGINKNSRVREAIDGGINISFMDAVCYADSKHFAQYYPEAAGFNIECPESDNTNENEGGKTNEIDSKCRLEGGDRNTFCEVIPHKPLFTGSFRMTGF